MFHILAAFLFLAVVLAIDRGSGLTFAAAESLLARSGLLCQEGQCRRGLRRVRRARRAYPDNPAYLRREAEIHHALKDFGPEAATWELFMKAAPKPSQACPAIGRAYDRLGLPDKSFQAYRRCRELDPQNMDTAFFIAREEQGRGQYEEAEKSYKKILAAAPKYTDASLGLARLRLRQNRIAESESLVSGVLKISAANPDALLLRSLLAQERGNKKLAIDSLVSAIAISPAYADLYRVLGRLYDQERSHAEAARVYAKLSELEPDNEGVRRRVEELRNAEP